MKRSFAVFLLSSLCVSSFAETLASFESDIELTKPLLEYKQMTVGRAAVGATQGTSSISTVTPAAPTAYPYYNVVFPTPQDISDNGIVGLEATNLGSQPEIFYLTVFDTAGKKIERFFTVKPGETRSCGMLLSDLTSASAYGMKSLPAYYDGFNILKPSFPTGFQKNQIKKIGIYIRKPVNTVYFNFDNIRVTDYFTWTQVFTGSLDQFGQRTFGNVPGQVTQISDLTGRLAAEKTELQNSAPYTDRTAIGSWATGPTISNSTGYFRTTKYNNKWYFLDPYGKLFFSAGLDTISPQDLPTPVQGREYMFQWLPSASEPEYQFMTTESVGGVQTRCFDFIESNIYRKYGSTGQPWIDMQNSRMAAWGFNTVGSFAWVKMWQQPNLPYTVGLTVDASAKFFSVKNATRYMPDVYDAGFAGKLETQLKNYMTWYKLNTDPLLIGYFTDNELPFMTFSSEFDMPVSILGYDSTALAAKVALVNRLKGIYGTITNLNTAWGSAYADWDTFSKPITVTSTTDAFKADMRGFIKSFASKYYSTWKAAIRKYDANHMYLGSKCNYFSKELLDSMRADCAVFSFTSYASSVQESFAMLDAYDKPVMLSEYGATAMDGNNFGIGVGASTVNTQAERAAFCESMMRSVLANRLFVGAHFFKLYDDPVLGNSYGGANSNLGMCDTTDTPYAALVTAMKRVHRDIYKR